MLVPVVLAGGAGTRLWPISRSERPKPFIPLADGRTLLEKTYRRVNGLSAFGVALSKVGFLTVCNKEHYFLCADELEKAGQQHAMYLLEPFGRNTAPAIAMAALSIQKAAPDALMLVLPADHLIGDDEKFYAAVDAAMKLAEQNYLVVFGIEPTRSETGFGYIKSGCPLSDSDEKLGYQVETFVEKPDLLSAQKMLADGGYFWNAGMFCFKPSVFLCELAEHAPEVYQAVLACWEAKKFDCSKPFSIPEANFALVPDVSIDYAVMERSKKVVVVPAAFEWSDIGSWEALIQTVQADILGNRISGDAVLVDCTNTYVQTEQRVVAVVGVSDLIVVDTGDAILVANPNESQKVRTVVAQLKKDRHESVVRHHKVLRPWGCYTVLETSENYKIKRIEVKPGGKLSLQRHKYRSEHWVVVEGFAKVTNAEQEVTLGPNESTYIKAGVKHRLENPGAEPCVMIEVQCGSYVGEDDIERFEDVYGRSAAFIGVMSKG